MRFTWTLQGAGWAHCTVADDNGQAEALASYITDAPEQFLTAVVNVVRYQTTTQANFEAEPTTYQWHFHRDGDVIAIRLIETVASRGTLLWSSKQPVGALARAVIRAFDTVAEQHGEDGYQTDWRRPFPRLELEALRTAWRTR